MHCLLHGSRLPRRSWSGVPPLRGNCDNNRNYNKIREDDGDKISIVLSSRFQFLVNISFDYFWFSRLTSSNVKFCLISALNSIWEKRNKLLG